MAAMVLALLASTVPVVRPVASTKPYYRAMGNISCKEWTRARSGKGFDPGLSSAIHGLWINGFVSGYNVAAPKQSGDLLAGRTRNQLNRFIDNYCKKYSGDSVSDAMSVLAKSWNRPSSAPDTNGDGYPDRQSAQVMLAIGCKEWQTGSKITRLGYGYGIRGYLTAYNRYGPDPTGDVLGGDQSEYIEAFVDGWCSTRPSSLIFGAIQPLIEQAKTDRIAGRLPAAGRKSRDITSPGEGLVD